MLYVSFIKMAILMKTMMGFLQVGVVLNIRITGVKN